MRFVRTDSFRKHYAKLPPEIRKKVIRQITYLQQDIRHPGLYSKKMVGQGDIWEARIDIHYRLTFQIVGDVIVLRKVGTHEIYRKP